MNNPSKKTYPPTHVLVFFSCLVHLTSPAVHAAELVSVDAIEFAQIFPADAEVRTLVSGLGFTEGPVWFGKEAGFLIFSDIPNNKLMKWTSEEGLSVFREPSEKINGNTLDLQGRLVSCEHWGRKVSLTKRDGTIIPLVSEFNGKKLNSPNDVVVRRDGTLWFTDPDYGLEGRQKEQASNNVYRYDPLTDELAAVATDFNKPNGLCFSPDHRLLYIADSGEPRHIRVFNVGRSGKLSDGRVFATLDKGGPDGIRCDRDGRVWSSSGDGAQIFSAEGKLIGRVVLPKAGANLCFGGSTGQTLFITARDGLYSVETKIRGAR